MTTDRFYSTLADELSRRATRAVLGKMGLVSQPLREFLAGRLERFAGTGDGFLADPVFEATFGWKTADRHTMSSLAGPLLAPALVDAMDAATGDEHFGKDFHPFEHQLEAWQTLLAPEVRSALVTSGTGSGKTECFVVPILSDLAREAERSGSLVGTRAIFLYPLNALINSQRDRLRAWTGPMGGRVRFCLYNGNTPDSVRKAEQDASPAEVLSREELRARPAPILVTNATMLEYMLVRQEDASILDQSKGALRWIVLDEAHTYVGSHAAELALLLRRVLHAFGVSSRDVRFVATSATIGRTGDPATREALRRYLADIAGVDPAKVTVVEGGRATPELPPELCRLEHPLSRPEDLETLSPADRYRALASSPPARAARGRLAEGPRKLSDLARVLLAADDDGARRRTLAFLDVARHAELDETPFLPLRGHLFHRTQSGLWACADPLCPHRRGTPLDDAAWPFGAVWFERREQCECGALAFEVVLCKGCGAEYLLARESAEGDHRRYQPASSEGGDEEVEPDLLDDEDDEESAGASPGGRRLLGIYQHRPVAQFDPRTGIARNDGRCVSVGEIRPDRDGLPCARCGTREKVDGEQFLPARGGGPFFLQVAMPALLEHAPKMTGKGERPLGGRRAITFSDSRQGTASFALRSEVEAERDYVRSFIYHQLSAQRPSDPHRVEEKRAEVARLLAAVAQSPQISAHLDPLLATARAELNQLELPQAPRLRWEELAEKLADARSLRLWLLPEWRRRVPGSTARNLAEFALYREFSRRPRRANSLETLGLVRVDYAGLENAGAVPAGWRQAGLDPTEWSAFLKLGLDFVVRGRSAIRIPEEYIRWLGVEPPRLRWTPPLCGRMSG